MFRMQKIMLIMRGRVLKMCILHKHASYSPASVHCPETPDWHDMILPRGSHHAYRAFVLLYSFCRNISSYLRCCWGENVLFAFISAEPFVYRALLSDVPWRDISTCHIYGVICFVLEYNKRLPVPEKKLSCFRGTHHGLEFTTFAPNFPLWSWIAF